MWWSVVKSNQLLAVCRTTARAWDCAILAIKREHIHSWSPSRWFARAVSGCRLPPVEGWFQLCAEPSRLGRIVLHLGLSRVSFGLWLPLPPAVFLGSRDQLFEHTPVPPSRRLNRPSSRQRLSSLRSFRCGLFRSLFHHCLLLHRREMSRLDQVLQRPVGHPGLGESVCGHLKMRWCKRQPWLQSRPRSPSGLRSSGLVESPLRRCSAPRTKISRRRLWLPVEPRVLRWGKASWACRAPSRLQPWCPSQHHLRSPLHLRHDSTQIKGLSCKRAWHFPLELGASPRDRTDLHGSSGSEVWLTDEPSPANVLSLVSKFRPALNIFHELFLFGDVPSTRSSTSSTVSESSTPDQVSSYKPTCRFLFSLAIAPFENHSSWCSVLWRSQHNITFVIVITTWRHVCKKKHEQHVFM